jgi:hypothetical protein
VARPSRCLAQAASASGPAGFKVSVAPWMSSTGYAVTTSGPCTAHRARREHPIHGSARPVQAMTPENLSVWGSPNGHALKAEGHSSAVLGVDGSQWPVAGRYLIRNGYRTARHASRCRAGSNVIGARGVGRVVANVDGETPASSARSDWHRAATKCPFTPKVTRLTIRRTRMDTLPGMPTEMCSVPSGQHTRCGSTAPRAEKRTVPARAAPTRMRIRVRG